MSLSQRITVSAFAAGALLSCMPNSYDGREAGERDPDLSVDESMLCKAEYQVSGEFTPDQGVIAPSGLDGTCWPFGRWDLTLTLEDRGGCEDVDTLPQYTYGVTASPSYRYQIESKSDTSDIQPLLKIKAGGNACQGTFEHFRDDGNTVLRIKPYVALDGTEIHGRAYLERHSDSQL